jgi:hypothetical protein
MASLCTSVTAGTEGCARPIVITMNLVAADLEDRLDRRK